MQSTIRSTSRTAAQNNIIGYLCMLVLLVFAIGLLALQTPAASPAHLAAPATGAHAALYQVDGQQDSHLGSYGD
jgi:hypothetical protein